MKYIIFEDFAGQPAPILFPDRVSHDEIREQVPYSRVLSAGYLRLTDKGLAVTGLSTSLNLRSRPEDLDIIVRHMSVQA